MRVKDLFSADDLDAIQQAIAIAEEGTTGEIRVHLTRRSREVTLVAAREMFGRVNMHKTEDCNGVLIYVDVNTRDAAVWSDVGLNDRLKASFWSDEIDGLTKRFAHGEYRLGVVEMVQDVGRVLHNFFPSGESQTANQLSNEVSIDDEEKS